MKLLVVSDIHGRGEYLDRVMMLNSDLDGVFFLGENATACRERRAWSGR